MRTLARLVATALLLLVLPVVTRAQLTVLPSEGKSLGSATAPEAGKWIVFGPGGFKPVQPVVLDGGKTVIWEGDAGEYAVIFLPPGDAQPLVQTVTLGQGVKPPDPPVPPPGNRWAVIWEETEQRNQHPGIGNLFLQLRKEFADEKLQILDVTNLPPSLRALESQRPLSLPLPVLMVVARQADKTDRVVRTVALPSSVAGVKAEIAK